MAISRQAKIGGGIGAAVLAAATAITFLVTGPTNVPVGANLQEYINNASTGDVLQLAEGATYVGNFFDHKGLTIQGPATLIAPDSTAAAQPTLYYPPKTPPAIVRNLTISSTTNPARQVFDVVKYGDHGGTTQDEFEEQPQGLTMENVTITCQVGQQCQRGIAANGRNFSISNFRILEIHGKGYDTQAIGVWNGSGPFKITDGHAEASGENIMFGGADTSIPNLTPSDIEIRRVTLNKPLSWRGVYTAKNLLELKHARNVTIDGIVLTNSWGDAQIGFGVLFTTRNQDGRNPWAIVENVSMTNFTMINVAGGFQLQGNDWPNSSQKARGLRIANGVIQLTQTGGNGRLVQIDGYDDVTIENIEADPPHSFALVTGTTLSNRFIYRNSLLSYGQYGLFVDGGQALALKAPDAIVTGNHIYSPGVMGKLPGNTYYESKPATVPTGVGVDYAALQAAQTGSDGPTPVPSVSVPPISPSPVLSPSLSPSPSPSPSPTSLPAGASPNGTKAATIIDSQLSTWTLGVEDRTMRDNVWTAGGRALTYKFVDGGVYAQGVDDKNWYRFAEGQWTPFGDEPMTGQGTPTPTPLPTVVPSTPTPTPVPTATPVSSPTPLPFCRSGERPGNPPRCRCPRGFQGGSGKCR